MVNRLFEDEFNKRMGGVTVLHYSSLKWTDKEAVAVSKVIATGVLKKLETLDLAGNQIGDAGVMALAEAAGKGTLPQLKDLYLDGNQQRCRRPSKPRRPGKAALPQLRYSSQPPDWRCRRDAGRHHVCVLPLLRNVPSREPALRCDTNFKLTRVQSVAIRRATRLHEARTAPRSTRISTTHHL